VSRSVGIHFDLPYQFLARPIVSRPLWISAHRPTYSFSPQLPR
jgi:hypothetical protein